MRYSGWRLFLRQWSIKNELKTAGVFMLAMIVVFLLSSISYYMYGKTDSLLYAFKAFGIWSAVFYLLLLIFYQLMKIILMAIWCPLVASASRDGYPKAMDMYEEAWNWRQ